MEGQMADYLVTCHTPDNNDQDRRMQGVGGPAEGGWWLKVDDVIFHIESPDGIQPNNLLELPPCPSQR